MSLLILAETQVGLYQLTPYVTTVIYHHMKKILLKR